MNFRKLLLTLHLIAGLVSAVILILLGLSGSVLVFESEIDHRLNASLAIVRPEGARLPLDELVKRLEGAHPGAKLVSIMLPVEDGLACRATLRGTGPGRPLNLAVNPYTGAELGSLDQSNTLMSTVHQFHTKLLLGDKGKLITGCGAILLLVLALSGLVLWLPHKVWKMSGSESGRRRNFELHNVLGVWSSVFMLIFAVTGMVIHWDDAAKTLVNRIVGDKDEPAMGRPAAPAAGAIALSAGRAQEIALNQVPGARVTGIMGLNNPRGSIRVSMKYPEDHTPLGRTNLYLDPATGAILSAQTSRTAPAGTRVAKLWNREIHTGDVFGWPTRIVASIASLALPLLAVTGPLIWWGRIRRRRGGAPAGEG